MRRAARALVQSFGWFLVLALLVGTIAAWYFLAAAILGSQQ